MTITNIPFDLIENGSEPVFTEINIIKDGKTARFRISAAETNNGRPCLKVVANTANSENQKTQQVTGTYLDLEARKKKKTPAYDYLDNPQELAREAREDVDREDFSS